MPRHLRFLLKTYVFLILIMLVFRVMALVMVYENIAQESFKNVLYAFFMGFRFDNVVICASLALPTLMYTVNPYFPKKNFFQQLSIIPLIAALVPIGILLMVDIFYFDHFYTRTTIVVINWIDDLKFGLKMIFDEPVWLLGLVFIPVFLFPIVRLPWRWLNQLPFEPVTGKRRRLYFVINVFIIGLLFLGIRGRIAIKSPIREGTAYFSDNPTLNQLGLNPAYTFFSSFVRSEKYKRHNLKYMKMDVAYEKFQKFQGYRPFEGKNPLSRMEGSGNPAQKNIVLIIMEGMSAHYTSLKKDPSWTPVLDQLAKEGWYFSRTFSSGIHTYNGIWSTLFSYPAPHDAHPLKRNPIPKLHSFPEQLGALGWQTFFFTTHDDQFDNMAGFVRQNGFKEIIHQANYPQEKVLSILGVPDHEMFRFALPILEKASKNGPFFVAMLTGSNHKPHIIPREVKKLFKGDSEKENIVRYSDWAIGELMRSIKSKPWAKDTIFAFVADHGQSVGMDSLDQILSYHHVPFIIWSPQNLGDPVEFQMPVNQVDVVPTIMGALGGTWINGTLGRDVRANPRDWTYFGHDSYTCLVFPTILECETRDSHMNRYDISPTLWPKTPSMDDKEAWNVTHAELQIAQEILISLPSFP